MKLIKALIVAALSTVVLTFLLFYLAEIIPAFELGSFAVKGVSVTVIFFAVFLVMALTS